MDANEQNSKVPGEARTRRPPRCSAPSDNYLVTEHLSRMPSVVARGLFYVTLLLVSAAAAYACLGKVDVVVRCRAVARPSAHKIKVLCDRSGYLTRIFVREGQFVAEGAPLFHIRSKETVSYRAKVAELRRTIPLKQQYSDTKIAGAREKLGRSKAEHESAVKVIRLKLEQNRLSVASIDAEADYWQNEARRLSDRLARIEMMFKKGVASVSERDAARGELDRARAEEGKLTSKKSIVVRERSILEQELAEADAKHEDKRGALEKEIRNLELEKSTTLESMQSELERNKKMLSIKDGAATSRPADDERGSLLCARRAGAVSELYFRNEGDYVRESDLLCTIVPAGSPLYMDIVVANRDVGFIEEGMDIRYKFDAFPYSDYGVLGGEVAAIPPSAVEDKSAGFVYRVRGTLRRKGFRIRGRDYLVKAGMTATAELVTERRSILSSILRKR